MIIKTAFSNATLNAMADLAARFGEWGVVDQIDAMLVASGFLVPVSF